ncbi:MAG: SO_0444 family Cu/Zn efflux transporter [Candidatus Tectomicrobia bacterium]|nr:SO_0444 family Cu/Zn efflux transporter [Candidatus Tectomicrobia bacterium]
MMPWRRHGITLSVCLIGVAVCWFLWNEYFAVMLKLVAESAPYLLIGFALAGLLKAVVPEDKVYRHLGGDSVKSVTLASLFGIPLPLCSCSVLPVATSLRRSGASKGATTSFLISTPETGLDSIGITYALLDPIMTVARPLGAFATALFTGSVVNIFVRRSWDGEAAVSPSEPVEDEHGHGHDHSTVFSPTGVGKRSPQEVGRESLSYAFGPLLDDLTNWLIIGLLVSGLIAVIVPDDFFGSVIPAGFVSSVLMLLIGTPMYICAAAATPVAATLIAKGLDPGAALVLLLVGPATNATTIAIIARLLGRRILVVHLIGVTGSALLLGLLINFVYTYFAVDLTAIVAQVVESGLSPVNLAAGALFVYLLVYSTVRMRLGPDLVRSVRNLCAPLGFDPLSPAIRKAAVAAVVALYLSTAFSVVGPGEAAWVVRLGRVVRTLDAPGLYVHLPLPVDRVTKLRTMDVRSVDQGFVRAANRIDVELSESEDLIDAAQVMSGEENILSLFYTVHFNVSEPYTYRYRVADPAALVHTFAEWSVRQTVANRSSSEVLVTDRAEIEQEVLVTLQAELDAVDSGVRAVAVNLLDAHAPPAVHEAFRDVASSLEDRARKIRQAEGYHSETLASARAEAFSLIQEAQGFQSEKLNAAQGQGHAFLSRLHAYRSNEELTRRRLYFDTVESALQGVKGLFLLGADVDVDLWNIRED